LPDVIAPGTDTVESLADLRSWARTHGLPAVLKLDGSWGGSDVVVVRAESELRRAFLAMTLRRSPLKGLKRYLIDRDVEALRFGPKRAISVQSYVAGRPANVVVACWRGEVLAHVAADVLQTFGPFGSATVVRVVDGDAMVAAARTICRKFDLSGLCGFDFVIERESGIAKLIEINARATQTGHFPLGPGRDLAAAFFTALSGRREIVPDRPFNLRRLRSFPRNGSETHKAPV